MWIELYSPAIYCFYKVLSFCGNTLSALPALSASPLQPPMSCLYLFVHKDTVHSARIVDRCSMGETQCNADVGGLFCCDEVLPLITSCITTGTCDLLLLLLWLHLVLLLVKVERSVGCSTKND